MSGSDEVAWGCTWVDGELDCFGSFLCRYAGGEAVFWVAVDGDGEGGGADGGVDDGLGREFEAVAIGFGQ